MYGLAGFMLGAKSGGAPSTWDLDTRWRRSQPAQSVVYPVSGGRGKVSSAIIGVAVFELLKTALQFLGVNANAQWIALGVIIFVAISLDIRKYVARK